MLPSSFGIFATLSQARQGRDRIAIPARARPGALSVPDPTNERSNTCSFI
jgi:hypothetical protein